MQNQMMKDASRWELVMSSEQKGCSSNCDVCFYRLANPDGGYCYMFEQEPNGECFQFKLPQGSRGKSMAATSSFPQKKKNPEIQNTLINYLFSFRTPVKITKNEILRIKQK